MLLDPQDEIRKRAEGVVLIIPIMSSESHRILLHHLMHVGRFREVDREVAVDNGIIAPLDRELMLESEASLVVAEVSVPVVTIIIPVNIEVRDRLLGRDRRLGLPVKVQELQVDPVHPRAHARVRRVTRVAVDDKHTLDILKSLLYMCGI